MLLRATLLVVAIAGCHARGEVVAEPMPMPAAAPTGTAPTPMKPVTPIAHDNLCVTKGSLDRGGVIGVRDPTVRAFARGSTGDAVSMRFVFRGDSAKARALSSGQMRRQLGLKLRAANSCNVVYVMWRLDPKSLIEVSVKSNPGMRTHRECGAEGYTKVKPQTVAPPLEAGARHTLAAEIVGDELIATIDGHVAWRGALPQAARDIRGPAGFRSDNVAFDIEELSAPMGESSTGSCREDSDESD
jgi:hypothetical protein